MLNTVIAKTNTLNELIFSKKTPFGMINISTFFINVKYKNICMDNEVASAVLILSTFVTVTFIDFFLTVLHNASL